MGGPLPGTPAATPASSPEPGYLTTEFWMAVAVQLISLLTLFGVIHIGSAQTQAILGMLGLVVPQALYALSRGLRKAGT